MNARDFCYWLQGFFEITGELSPENGLTEKQIEIIKTHLKMVFATEIDPSFGPPKTQQLLSDLHNSTQLLARC